MSGFLAVFAAGGSAAAAPKRISGELARAGYTVIAIDAGGEAASVEARSGKFRLTPPAKRVTLHLRGADGTYAGPIVTGRKGKRAIVGVKAGAKLGEIKLRAGYAKLAERLPEKFIDQGRTARAKNKVPIGAGNFGRVAARADGVSGPGGDQDLDGLPGTLDIDDDGDLVLDDFEAGAGAPRDGGTSAPRGLEQSDPIGLGASLTLDFFQSVNANGGSTDAEIEAALPTFGNLAMSILGDGAELDCGGLLYCSLGGTGRLVNAPMPEFPECCDDDDHDGDGTMVSAPNIPGLMQLLHGAVPRDPDLDPAISQIGTGDELIERLGDGSVVTALVPYVAATVPALRAYSDGTGNQTTVAYPVAEGAPGTSGNPFPVKAGSNGDVVLTLEFWRPQRRPIPKESCLDNVPPCEWVDIGGLIYTAALGTTCPQGTLSTADPDLTVAPPTTPPVRDGGFLDMTGDQAADPLRTVAYSLNVTDCLEAKGQPAWAPNETKQFNFMAADNGGGDAMQNVSFRLLP